MTKDQESARPAPPRGDLAKAPGPPAQAAGGARAHEDPAPAKELTPEEQMALFEKELKEKDWGHQPC
jgi:hypothetical protein